jgi:hypothetical protein
MDAGIGTEPRTPSQADGQTYAAGELAGRVRLDRFPHERGKAEQERAYANQLRGIGHRSERTAGHRTVDANRHWSRHDSRGRRRRDEVPRLAGDRRRLDRQRVSDRHDKRCDKRREHEDPISFPHYPFFQPRPGFGSAQRRQVVRTLRSRIVQAMCHGRVVDEKRAEGAETRCTRGHTRECAASSASIIVLSRGISFHNL